MAANKTPDWPPRSSAFDYPEGWRQYGSTGQLFEVKSGRWQRVPRYFISQYTDGPATRWNVIDRQNQELVRRFATEAEAQSYASEMDAR